MASRLERWGQRLIDEPGLPGLGPDVLRLGLAGCACAYDAGLETYLGLEAVGLRRRTSLPIPVISVGNLTVGGTGKTPMTQWLCRRLLAKGIHSAVLSRGHGSRRSGGTGGSVRVVSEVRAARESADDVGDEPTLLAHTLPGVPVLVGKNRRLSGREAMRRFALDALVLDDGFQYWQLARDMDIVLLDARRPFDNGWSLPRGLLREARSHLRRAHVVVVTRSDQIGASERAGLSKEIAAIAPGLEVFWAHHRPTCLAPADGLSGPNCPLDWLLGRRVVALSGIAQPQSFYHALTQCGADVADHLIFSDHARYADEDVRRTFKRVKEAGAAGLIMTEKDAVKWPEISGPATYALRIEMQVENEASLLAMIDRRAFERRRA